jgi:hypothetical protein
MKKAKVEKSKPAKVRIPRAYLDKWSEEQASRVVKYVNPVQIRSAFECDLRVQEVSLNRIVWAFYGTPIELCPTDEITIKHMINIIVKRRIEYQFTDKMLRAFGL